jgi:hypothetical protein
LKIKGLLDIYGKCVVERSGFADKENSIGEPQGTKIDQSSEDHLFDPGRNAQARRRTVRSPYKVFLGGGVDLNTKPRKWFIIVFTAAFHWSLF